MKSLSGLLLAAFVAVPVLADTITYDNGGPNLSTTPEYSISGSFAGKTNWVSDTFTVATSGTPLNLVQLAIWTPTGATMTQLTYCISGVTDCSSSLDESIVGDHLTQLSTLGTSGAYTLNEYSFNLQRITYQAGTYWLMLENANVSTGTAYWDTNNGTGCQGDGKTPSGCPSGAVWSMQENPLAVQGQTANNNSESFVIFGAPEPGSLALLGSGLFLVAGMAFRRRRR